MMPDLFIFTPNGDASALDFLNDPFLPVNIVDQSGQYANIQLLTILSTDAPDACPFFNAIHNVQLMNSDTVSQSQAENSFTFDVPSDQNATQYVVEGNLVAFKDLDGNYQLFEIRKVDEYHTDASYTEAYCVHAAPTELVDEWVDNVVLTNATPAKALAAVLDGTRWMVGTVNLTNTGSLTIQRTNGLSGLSALIAGWGGEIQYRVEISGTSITGMYVDWLQTVGNTTGKRFEYGKDISSVQRTLDTRNVKTALYGYGQQNSDGTYVNFANVTWSKANGDPVDKPSGQTWVGDPTALSQWGRAGGTRNRFGSFNDSQQTDPATLLHETWSVLQTVNTPLVSYQMSVVDLETMMGYSWESVRIGDTVNVIDTTFNPVLRLTARVVQIQRDIINPDNTQITLGNFLPTLAGKQAQLQNVNQTDVGTFDGGLANTFQPGSPLPTTQLQGVIDALRNQVQSTGAYVYVTDSDGILVLDKPKDQNPAKAIKLGGGVLAIANSKDANGQWKWTTFGTGDGFTADHITSGTLAGISLLLGGLNNGNGQFTLEDDTGTTMITMDNTGIKLKNGATMVGGSGVISVLEFESSGWYSGWQSSGWWDNGGGYQDDMAFLFAYIPDNFVITAATLYVKAMPVQSYSTSTSYLWYNVTNARLSYASGSDALNMYGNGQGSGMVVTPNTKTDITSQTWGGYWNPPTSGITVKSADVKAFLTPGQRIWFGVDSHDTATPTTTVPQAGGMVQMELVVNGYYQG